MRQQLPIAHSGILHVPQLSHNLISIKILTTSNYCCILFDSNGYLIQDLTTHHPLLSGKTSHGRYPIHTTFSYALCSALSSTSKLHSQLGHPHRSTILLLSKQFSTICTPTIFICTHCNSAKSQRLPFPSATITHISLEFIHFYRNSYVQLILLN